MDTSHNGSCLLKHGDELAGGGVDEFGLFARARHPLAGDVILELHGSEVREERLSTDDADDTMEMPNWSGLSVTSASSVDELSSGAPLALLRRALQ